MGGLVAGTLASRFGARHRWLLLLLAWLTCEVLRLPVDVPTTRFSTIAHAFTGSSYALGALLLGRGVDLLVGLVPLGVGLALGRRDARRPQRAVTLVVASVLAVGSAATLLPASTAPIPDGVAEVARVRIGGCMQRLVIRGASASNPVIFFLSGGPGGTEIGTLRNQWSAIEREFTVVVWDQTGAGLNGRCFPRNGRLTLERIMADGIAALEYANARFGQEVIVVGNSWGTFLGVKLVQARPDLVSTYVGTGQMVDLRATDIMFYDDTLAWARSHGRADVVERLVAQGLPPYSSMYPYEDAFAHESDWNPWDRDPAVGAAVNPLANVMDKPELDPVAKARYVANLIDTFSVLYPQVQSIDFRRDVTTLQVPVYLAQGVHEARGRAVLARAWFDGLHAPHKEWVDFPRSGHKAFGEQPDAFLDLLRRIAG